MPSQIETNGHSVTSMTLVLVFPEIVDPMDMSPRNGCLSREEEDMAGRTGHSA